MHFPPHLLSVAATLSEAKTPLTFQQLRKAKALPLLGARSALETLVAQQWLKRTPLDPEEPLYRLNAHRPGAAELLALVQTAPGHTPSAAASNLLHPSPVYQRLLEAADSIDLTNVDLHHLSSVQRLGELTGRMNSATGMPLWLVFAEEALADTNVRPASAVRDHLRALNDRLWSPPQAPAAHPERDLARLAVFAHHNARQMAVCAAPLSQAARLGREVAELNADMSPWAQHQRGRSTDPGAPDFASPGEDVRMLDRLEQARRGLATLPGCLAVQKGWHTAGQAGEALVAQLLLGQARVLNEIVHEIQALPGMGQALARHLSTPPVPARPAPHLEL